MHADLAYAWPDGETATTPRRECATSCTRSPACGPGSVAAATHGAARSATLLRSLGAAESGRTLLAADPQSASLRVRSGRDHRVDRRDGAGRFRRRDAGRAGARRRSGSNSTRDGQRVANVIPVDRGSQVVKPVRLRTTDVRTSALRARAGGPISISRREFPATIEKEIDMTYAIIGAGLVGATLARLFAVKDIPVLIANSHGPAFDEVAAEPGRVASPSRSRLPSKPISSSSRSERSRSRTWARCCETGRARSSST